jgi:hypothetical protein
MEQFSIKLTSGRFQDPAESAPEPENRDTVPENEKIP